LDEAAAGSASFNFSDRWRHIGAEQINVDVVTRATKARCAGQRVAFGFDSEREMSLYDLAFTLITFSAMPGAAHRATSTRRCSRYGLPIALSVSRGVFGRFGLLTRDMIASVEMSAARVGRATPEFD
jgi:hypothetical protein